MNGIHDLGGMHGFGPVVTEENEPPFHQPWEGRVLAMQRAMGVAGLWTIDQSRASMEALPPQTYLSIPYYVKWLKGLEDRIKNAGLVGEDEHEALGVRISRNVERVLFPIKPKRHVRGRLPL